MKQDPDKLTSLLSDSSVRGLVFDLDGTIIDSATDIINGMRLTFEQAGLGRLPDDYFPDDLHGTCEGIIRSIIAEMGWHYTGDPASLCAQYVKNYATLNHQTTGLYDGVLDVLKAFQEAGLPMAICTNKIQASALAVTQKLGIHDMFGFITGADTWAQAKPSPLPLLETIRMLDLAPEECVYFGDTSVDAECAQAADVRFVLHEGGYGDQAIRNTPQRFAFRHWHELLATPALTPAN